MKTVDKLALGLIMAVLLTVLYLTNHIAVDLFSAPSVPEPQPTTSPDTISRADHTPEGDIVQEMQICGTALSDARQRILASQIYRVGSSYLKNPQQLQAFVGLLCIETKYNPTAKSPRGALGIAQILPKYASEFAANCGLGKIVEADLLDTEVNLRLGACQFGHLLDELDGNIALALSGYNSGQDSDTTKRLAKLMEGNAETMGYVARFYTYIQKVQLAEENK